MARFEGLGVCLLQSVEFGRCRLLGGGLMGLDIEAGFRVQVFQDSGLRPSRV